MSTEHAAPKPGLLRGWPLGWRLPLSICAVMIIALEVFLGITFRRVEQTLTDAGVARARAAATQLANVFERSARTNRDDIRRLASSLEVRRFLSNPGDAHARLSAQKLLTANGASARRVEVWSVAGERLLEISRDDTTNKPPRSLPPATWPLLPGISPFQKAGDFVYFDNVEEVRTSAAPAAVTLGYLLIRGTIVVSPSGALDQLVGTHSRVLIGNDQDDAWTDFARIVDPPPYSAAHDGALQYQSSDDGPLLAGVARVRDTPWAVWIEFSRGDVVAPAVQFNRQMTFVALIVAAVAAFMVRGFTGRLTTPLASLTKTAEAMAGGDYGKRVPRIKLWPELTRLGESFNAMATNVENTHRTLEAQIQERTSALEALQVSEARYRAIIDVALDSIMTIDANGVIQEFNPAAERTFGYRRHEAVGRELASLIIPPHLRSPNRFGLQTYAQTGDGPVRGRLIEMTAMRADGSEFPVEIAITGVDTEGGRGRLFTMVVRDITQRKRAEAALVESERAFRSTFDEAPLGIAQISVDGRWLRANRQVSTLFGYEPGELLGSHFEKLFADELRGNDKWSDIVAEGTTQGAQERRGRRKDGHFVWVNLTISAHNDDTGVPIYFIVIMEDTSERRRLEERLRQSQKMEAIGQLAGGVAHDFNNMLTAILGYAYFLADEFPPDDPRRKDVEEIVRAGERSAALTRQLLAFSRKQILQPAVLNLNVLVGDTTEMLRRVIGEHIQIETSLADDVHPVCADPTQLEQIVMNLAVNARDAMPGGGRLTITTRNVCVADEANNDNDTGPVMPGTYVELAVSDDGYGMDDDTKRRLFEPFFTTKEQGQGTGLGLATVYGIVKQSGGHIAVESEPLQGSTFKVYLPAVLDVSAIAIRQTGTFPAARGTETILLVEDERAVRTLTRAILERGGYTVLDAASPEEALDLFLEHRDDIQLLISDVVMPGSSGPGLYERLVVLHPSLRVLFMSGYTDDGVRDNRSGAGVEFIEKPFTAIRLMQKVRDVLDRRV